MSVNCGCPASSHLANLEIADCKESFGQIQKIIIQRIYKETGVLNKIEYADITSKEKMMALASAANGTKIIISPYIQAPETEPGAARTFGGGNQTLSGIEIVIGREPTTFTGVMYQELQNAIATMKQYSCENIGVYLIDENGNIGALSNNKDNGRVSNSAGTSYRPIPIRSFFVGDKKLGGYEEPDSNAISWSFVPNWSDDLVMIKASSLDYNPLTDLSNVSTATEM